MKNNPYLNKFRSQSIKTELALIIVLTLLVSSLTVGLFSYYTAKNELDKSGEVILKNGVRMVKKSIELKANLVALNIQDQSAAQEEVKRFVLGPKQLDGTRQISNNIDLGRHGYIFILDKQAYEIAHPSIEGENTWLTKDMSGKDFYVAQDIIQKALSGGGFTHYSWKYPYDNRIAPKVAYAEYDPYWEWIIVSTIYMEDYNKGANRIITMLLYAFFSILVIGILSILLISKHISTPLTRIAKAMSEFKLHLPFEPLQKNGDNEIGVVTDAFNQMASALIEENTLRLSSEQALHQLNLELEQRVNERTEELQKVHTKLIESEKMSAVTHLVFGIAHEINTPLGNAITLGSYIQTSLGNLKVSLNNGQLSKSAFNESFSDVQDGLSIMNCSLSAASKLIENFKEISPESRFRKLCEFNLLNLLEIIPVNFSAELARERLHITIVCSETLILESYPEDFNHIFYHLIKNSLAHGFKNIHERRITIEVIEVEDEIELLYSDNGVGIVETDLKRICEPFYTTQRHEGHTGLGLFIVYNVVINNLKGKIAIQNNHPGLLITLRLPKKLNQ